jgi:hypothetical protein
MGQLATYCKDDTSKDHDLFTAKAQIDNDSVNMKGKSGNMMTRNDINENVIVEENSVHKGKSGNTKTEPEVQEQNQAKSEEESRYLLKEYTQKFLTETLANAMKFLQAFSTEDYLLYKIPKERIEKVENYPNLRTEIINVDEESNSFYSGSVNQKNQKHGYGILMKRNGERYEGYFEHDCFQPFGRYINEKGEVFEGAFENGKLNGEGKMNKSDKEYKGSFFYGLRNGYGVETSETEQYEGYFKNDKKDGNGTLTFKKTINKYIGDFKDGKMTGNCDFSWNSGDRYVGNIVNGTFDGRGKYYWSDGMEYEGNYDKGTRRGFGVFKWKDGKIYKGEFENNLPHGNGVIIHNGIEKNIKSQMGAPIVSGPGPVVVSHEVRKEEKINSEKANVTQENAKPIEGPEVK